MRESPVRMVAFVSSPSFGDEPRGGLLMAREPKIRLVAFIPSTLAEQYTALSKQSGLSRSELVRMALQHAHRSIAVWCEKYRDD